MENVLINVLNNKNHVEYYVTWILVTQVLIIK